MRTKLVIAGGVMGLAVSLIMGGVQSEVDVRSDLIAHENDKRIPCLGVPTRPSNCPKHLWWTTAA